jgi:hypothetical protein
MLRRKLITMVPSWVKPSVRTVTMPAAGLLCDALRARTAD